MEHNNPTAFHYSRSDGKGDKGDVKVSNFPLLDIMIKPRHLVVLEEQKIFMIDKN